MKSKLTAKLLFPLVALVILGLSISIAMAYFYAKNGFEKNITHQLDQISRFTEAKVSQWLSRNKIAIGTWSRMDVMINSLESSDREQARVAASSRMAWYIDQYKIFSGMRLTNDQGLVIASSHKKILIRSMLHPGSILRPP